MSPTFTLQDHGEVGKILQSALVIDAKALYDCLRAETPQLQGDKRTKIEAMIVKEKMNRVQHHSSLGLAARSSILTGSPRLAPDNCWLIVLGHI